ncbi:TIGR02757 family protein [Sulfurospirillum sp. 1307]
MNKIQNLLLEETKKRDTLVELSEERPDPLMVAKDYNDEFVSLICALFAYGNARLIVKFLRSLDFSLLDKNEDEIRENLKKHYYRFQSSNDIVEFFITLNRFKKASSIEDIFKIAYKKNEDVMSGLKEVISYMYELNSYRSRGYEFLIGKIPSNTPASPYKRWHMYLRWMVRKDNLDMGLWSGIDKKNLLVPLDTHTFKVGQKLGLIKRKSYDFKAVVELTESFRKIDKSDPVKFDFALYRIGQENLLED